MLKALFVFKIFLRFGCVEKRPDEKTQVNFKVYGVTDWTTNYCNSYVA